MIIHFFNIELARSVYAGVFCYYGLTFILKILKDRSLHSGPLNSHGSVESETVKAIFTTGKNKQVYLHADRSVDYGTAA